MNYYGAKQLVDGFRTVRRNTLQIAEDIPESRYAFAPIEGARTIGRLLVHIAVSPQWNYQLHAVERRTSFEGFDIFSLRVRIYGEEASPRTKAEIVELLRTEGDVWADFLEGVSEEFLGETVTMPDGATPPTRSRFEMLLSIKEHEMHHRGQLMVAERMVGVVPHLTRVLQEHAARAQASSADPRE